MLAGKSGGDNRSGRNGNDIRLNYKLPKIDFPQFGGENPRQWARKANKYFQLHLIPEELKLGIAEMYLKGKAYVWFHGFLSSHSNADWGLLTTEVYRRFNLVTEEAVDEVLAEGERYGSHADFLGCLNGDYEA
ncbi:Uncharacterized protein Adt_36749 [Abeliophyllum distichum]|uniref:Uncharacterized protein n=1 Tax=Abeliophyllum distichum TaxID=126358 RepID=A0ABD1QIG2_9LAMI